ncbi:MAG: S8 family peptidase [Pseudanabaena sp. M165S2SP1A06QC]|nr:S8 family peptidase [Pseudanabaena sp. M046S1SP1A06QC]MCA6624095.1 S8 family peptidase [Pseudanabaena sp. M165S2SP1A06QC]
MSERARQFPHIELQFAVEGAAFSRSIPRTKTSTTLEKIGDRGGHGSTLKNSVSGIVSNWQAQLEDRKQEQKPDLPKAVPLILQIDPTAFDAEELRKFGIEVIAELEDGYIIGASADLQLTELQRKIEQFINSERGGGKVPEIWDILDGTRRPDYILSPELQEQWGQIQDNQTYVVDVGISCVGTKSQLRDYPRRESYKGDDNYIEAIHRWMSDRTLTYEEWDNLKLQRESDFESFVDEYQGEILHVIDAETSAFSELPDSFSCRIKIFGKGLKDLVLNFSYVFEVSLPDIIHEETSVETQLGEDAIVFTLEAPEPNAPKVCIIDSGIQEQHPLLRAAILTNDSRSWIPNETNLTADFVSNGGHGTRVAGAVLYPTTVPQSGQQQAICWLQNARVLDRNCSLPKTLYPPVLISDIVKVYQDKTKTKIFNHSITASTPCRNQYMSAWAAEIDNLTWQHDILFIVAAGNLPRENRIGNSRLSIRDHIENGKNYPNYLLDNSCRVPNPAQSFQALTVGSISSKTFRDISRYSIAQKDYPSSFSCSGLGIWDSIKPEVVEYGGDLVVDGVTPPSFTTPSEVCPELVRSTLNGGPLVSRDIVGTSFAAPKVTHIAACLAAELPNESCLLYRALIIQSARLPEWVYTENFDPFSAVRLLGYGIPELDRALSGSSNRITLIAKGDRRIAARQVHVYQVSLPNELRSPGEDFDIRVEITLSYKAQPRRTRRARRKYLSTWLDWECSKKGEDPDRFKERMIQKYDAPTESEEGEKLFDWFLGKQKLWGKAKNVSRGTGTVQKDWTTVKSYDLRESFCIAIVGHEGWNNDPNADVPYALVVSFETVDTNIPIYTAIANIQVPIQVESEVSVSVSQ